MGNSNKNLLAAAAIVGGIVLFKKLNPGGGGSDPVVTHPKFVTGDVVRQMDNPPAGAWYNTLKIISVQAGTAPTYGTYQVQMQDGPQVGWYTAFTVAEIDANYHKIS
jgi:hypothetical protein